MNPSFLAKMESSKAFTSLALPFIGCIATLTTLSFKHFPSIMSLLSRLFRLRSANHCLSGLGKSCNGTSERSVGSPGVPLVLSSGSNFLHRGGEGTLPFYVLEDPFLQVQKNTTILVKLHFLLVFFFDSHH